MRRAYVHRTVSKVTVNAIEIFIVGSKAAFENAAYPTGNASFVTPEERMASGETPWQVCDRSSHDDDGDRGDRHYRSRDPAEHEQ